VQLDAYVCGGELLQWITNWSLERKQQVVLNGHCSSWEDVLSGVSQGSVLGPLLFVIYINDIDDSVNSKILKFADDTKVFNAVGSEKDVDSLRCGLCNLVQWSKEWQMLFNVEKCKVMHFGYNSACVNYEMDGIDLECVSSEKVLGVEISEDLKWDNQWKV